MEKKYKIHLAKYACANRPKNMPQVELTFKQFDEILANPVNTGESMTQYEELEDPLIAKDRGGYVAGELKDNYRSNENVLNRCMVTIDIDGKKNGVNDLQQVEDVEKSIQSQYIVHSTRSYRKDDPHVRLVIPLSRPVNNKEFEAITNEVCRQLNIQVDRVSRTEAQLMFLPTRSKDQPFYHNSKIEGRDPLDVEAILSAIPKVEDEPKTENKRLQAAKVIDPLIEELDTKKFTGKLNSFEYVSYMHNHPKEFEAKLINCGLLEAAKKTGFICPHCGNGGGKNGTGVVINPKAKDDYHYICFGCGRHEDILEYIDYPKDAKIQGLHSKVEYVRDKLIESYKTDMIVPISEAEYLTIEHPLEGEIARPVSNIPDMIDALNGDTHVIDQFLEDSKKFAKRDKRAKKTLEVLGLDSLDIGVVDQSCFIPGGDENFDKLYLVVPTSNAGCVFIDPVKCSEFALDTNRLKDAVNTPAGLFLRRDLKALTGEVLNDHPQQAIILTNRTIDMLAFYQAGAPCVISAANNTIEEIASLLQALDSTKPIVLVYSDDDTSKAKLKTDSDYLSKQGFEVKAATKHLSDLYQGYATAIEALNGSKDKFADKVAKVYSIFEREFEDGYLSNHLKDFKKRLVLRKNTPYLKTGFFRKLDGPSMLDGGLFGDNVYFLGGITGCGKTTLALQIADNLACSGVDVIYYALEMSEDEIIARCVSRRSWLNDPIFALTEKDVLDPRRHAGFNERKYQNMQESLNDLMQTAGKHMRIVESVGGISAKDIQCDIKRFKEFKPNAPLVIFIDYLQILSQPKDITRSMTDKQIVDINTITLKQTARDYNIPIFTLSSLNRDSYNHDLSLSDFKESGSIEYTGSVAMSMDMFFRNINDGKARGVKAQQDKDQLEDENTKTIAREKIEGYRTIRLKILKNRQGEVGEETYFAYKSPFNCFIEIDNPLMQKTKRQDKTIQSFMDPNKELKDYTMDQQDDEVDQPATKSRIDIYNLIHEYDKTHGHNPEFDEKLRQLLKPHGVKDVNQLEGKAIDDVFFKLDQMIKDEAAQVKITQ